MSPSSALEQQVRLGVGAVREAGTFREAMRPSMRMAPSPDIALSLVQPLNLPFPARSDSGWHQLHTVLTPPHSDSLVPRLFAASFGCVCGWSLLG